MLKLICIFTFHETYKDLLLLCKWSKPNKKVYTDDDLTNIVCYSNLIARQNIEYDKFDKLHHF